MKKLFVLVVILIGISLLSGCIKNQKDEKPNRTIRVYFKSDTNITYLTYLEEKYNLTAGASSIYQDGILNWVHFTIPKDEVNNIMEQLKKEDQIERVVFADEIG